MFSNLILSTILAISFGLIMVVLLTVAGVDFQRIFGITEKTDSSGRRLNGNAAAYELNATLLESVRLMRNALIFDGDDKVKAQIASLRKTQAERKEYLDFLERCAIANRGRNLLAAIALVHKVYVGSEDAFIGLVEAGQMEEAKAELLSRACPAQWSYIEAVNALIQFQEANAGRERAMLGRRS